MNRPTQAGDLVPMSTREVRDSGLMRLINDELLHARGFALAIIAPLRHAVEGDLSSELVPDFDSDRAGLAMVRSIDGSAITYEPEVEGDAPHDQA